MSQTVSLSVRGLVTNVNELAASDGALRVADNIVINKESVAEMCRGFALVQGELNGDCNRLMFYQGQLLTNQLTALQNYEGSLRAVSAHSNLYLVTSVGVIKLDSATTLPVMAGVPKALDVTTAVGDKSGFLPKDQQVAYRVVWGYTDANRHLILGAPSQRVVVTNATSDSEDKTVKLDFSIPPGITEKHFFQVYRSEASASASDELSLVIQQSPTLDEIRANHISITDTTPRTLSGAALYTNETQEGILQANEQPPIAGDIALFRDCLFFGNTRSKHQLFLTLYHVGGSDGLALGDIIKIGEAQFTAAAAENPSQNEFAIFQSSSSLGVSETIESLIRIVNQSGVGLYAYSFETSDDPDDIGKILIESRQPFCVEISSHPSAFKPSLPLKSRCEINKNSVYFSKFQQFEAVPLTNFLKLGSSDNEIVRMIPLRDALFCLTSEGLYRINGWTPESFNRELFDSSVKVVGAETPAVLSNSIFCLTTQGVVAINDVGSSIVSRAIKDIILFILSPCMYEKTQKLAFGIAYESEGKYILFVPSQPSDEVCTQALVYNLLTNTWTRWIRSAACGFLHPLEDKLYLGMNRNILVERKGTENDYLDENEKSIVSRLEWPAQHAGNPFAIKQWAEAGLAFRKRGQSKLDFHSDLSPEKDSISISKGGRYFRTYIPAQKQLASTLSVGLTCCEPFELEGISLTTTGEASERITR
jgi:hypothetical protein